MKIELEKKVCVNSLENVTFIKTTGVHITEGLILHKNFEVLKKVKLIENHKIFNYVCKHFKTR